jgi:hypothetical protein
MTWEKQDCGERDACVMHPEAGGLVPPVFSNSPFVRSRNFGKQILFLYYSWTLIFAVHF